MQTFILGVLGSILATLLISGAYKAWQYSKKVSPKPTPGILSYYQRLAEEEQHNKTA